MADGDRITDYAGTATVVKVKQPPMNQQAVDARHETFCQEYSRDFNARRAQIAAGYSDKSQAAYMLMQRAEIRERIRELVEERKKNYETDINLMLDELRLIAMMNVTEFPLDEDGSIDFSALTPEQGRCIASIETTVGKFGTSRKIKMHNKLEALLASLKLCGVGVDLPKVPSDSDEEESDDVIFELHQPKELSK